jgi:hypothetical protein
VAKQQQQQQVLEQHQDDMLPAVAEGHEAGPTSSSSSARAVHDNSTTTNGIGSSRNTQGLDFSGLLALADRIQRMCQPRVLLLGCSYQFCTNLSGPSAEGLVAGCKGVVCGGCGLARYCRPACQEEDWRQHQHDCRRLRARRQDGVKPCRAYTRPCVPLQG